MDTAITYSIKLPARTLRAVPAGSGVSQWIVGTTSLREDNEIRVLEYDAGHDQLVTRAAWVHPSEVWDAASCPDQPDRLITVHSKVGVHGVTLWHAAASEAQLTPVVQLQHEGIVRRVLWGPQAAQQLLTVEEGALRIWAVAPADIQAAGVCQAADLEQFWTAAPHPRAPQQVLAAAGNGVQLWDLSSQKQVAAVESAHRMTCRDVSWAPNNEYRFVSAGDDCKLRFWDTRMLTRPVPLLELSGHSHWVWHCCYSPFHDQLLLSSSTDTTVALWYTPALAKLKSADSKQLSSRAAATQAATSRQESDGKVMSYDEHEDSVYGLAWSSEDPWLFASMSFDGRLVLNKVPKNIKYKILI